MYDDYELDFSISHDYNLDEDYLDSQLDQLDYLDEDYSRDTQDFVELSIQHYA